MKSRISKPNEGVAAMTVNIVLILRRRNIDRYADAWY
jgi:hypothetical protein